MGSITLSQGYRGIIRPDSAIDDKEKRSQLADCCNPFVAFLHKTLVWTLFWLSPPVAMKPKNAALNHTSSAHIIQIPLQQGGREFVVDLTALHLATHHEVVASPAMVCSLAIRCQGATKVRGCDQDH